MRRLLLSALLLAVATVGFATRGAADDWTPRPVIPKAQGERCVEPTEVMRKWHNEIVRPADGSSAPRTLPHHDIAGCVSCHAERDKNGAYVPVNAEGQFCESCHRFSAVSINCFSCHAATPQAAPTPAASTADHSRFDVLKQNFASGQEVTAACLTCHTEAGKQLRATDHWTWSLTNPRTGQALGKLHTISLLLGSVAANQGQCPDCHIGQGWKDGRVDFASASDNNVDCLVCHDTTGRYNRVSTDAGKSLPGAVLFPHGGAGAAKPADLSFVARHVGKTSRETCGSCHFNADGGDGVKHGDLDSSLANPKRTLDVHMGTDGLNFACSACHVGKGHVFTQSLSAMAAKETRGINVPGHDDSGRATCESCHGSQPHRESPHRPAIFAEKLNEHTDKVACETCHIPSFARGGVPTETEIDGSTAGKKDADGKPLRVADMDGHVIYETETGDSKWAENVEPTYAWFNGDVRFARLGETIDPKEPVALNIVEGKPGDDDARVWPFKAMRGKAPYDAVAGALAVAQLSGDDDAAYWKSYDWNKAIAAGMKAAGADYSGTHGFVDATMSLPLAHMVAPAQQALQCNDCHRNDGRLASVETAYMPGRDRSALLEWLGWLAVGASLAGVSAHGVARMALAGRGKRKP